MSRCGRICQSIEVEVWRWPQLRPHAARATNHSRPNHRAHVGVVGDSGRSRVYDVEHCGSSVEVVQPYNGREWTNDWKVLCFRQASLRAQVASGRRLGVWQRRSSNARGHRGSFSLLLQGQHSSRGGPIVCANLSPYCGRRLLDDISVISSWDMEKQMRAEKGRGPRTAPRHHHPLPPPPTPPPRSTLHAPHSTLPLLELPALGSLQCVHSSFSASDFQCRIPDPASLAAPSAPTILSRRPALQQLAYARIQSHFIMTTRSLDACLTFDV